MKYFQLKNIRQFVWISLLATALVTVGCGGSSTDKGGEQDTTNQQMNAQTQGQQGQKPPQMKRPKPAENVSDDELQKFATAMQELRSLQQDARGKMEDAIKEEGMDVKQYQKLQQQQRNPKAQGQGGQMSDKEKKQMQNIQKKMQKIQMNMRPKQKKAIKDVGLTMQRYQSIFMALRQDSTLAKRFQNVRQGQDGGAPMQ